MMITSRATAKLLGLKRYFTGEPCIYGHVSERRTHNGVCIACEALPKNRQRAIVNANNAKDRNRKKDHEGFKSYQARLARERRAVLKIENPEMIKARDARTWAQRDKEASQEYMRKWRADNADHIREADREHQKRERAENINAHLSQNLRNRLNRAIKRNSAAGSAVRDLGCSIEQLKIHLEAQFAPGMSWDNWGEWHIDHIKPLSAFDLTDRAQFLAACNYSNLQPLWEAENLRKSNKV
jgi:hypothetical protein